MIYRLIFAAFISILAFAPKASCADELKGKIVSVHVPKGSMVITAEDGSEVQATIDKNTLARKGKIKKALQALSVGDPVMLVTEEDEEGNLYAKEVHWLDEEPQQMQEEAEHMQEEDVEQPEPAAEPEPAEASEEEEEEPPQDKWSLFR